LNKKVFVVIVTYNGAKWIDKNITSLLNSSYPVNIIVIDNNSTDNSVALLEKYPEAELIKSTENLGFGRANNIGMKKALDEGADYIFLLNQDAWIFDDTVTSLINNMEQHKICGIISPMHYVADEVTLDGNFKNYLSKAKSRIKSLPVVEFVNAAAWMMSRECIEKVGMFEPAFSHYGEDRNYCDRVLYHKFQIGIDVHSRIVHDRTITRNFNKDIIQSRYQILCRLLDINKNLGDSYLSALKSVFGLPKYFSKHYSAGKSIKLFFSLLVYYMEQVFSLGKIKSIRNSHK
jgi:GT2 family glycosyltransferase